mgnify:CR=1 FL=1
MSNETKILAMASYQDYKGIAERQSELIVEKMKLDRFFSMFLDKFEKKMNPDLTDTPVWKLYKNKLKEYEDVQRAIKLSDYYLKKAAIQYV